MTYHNQQQVDLLLVRALTEEQLELKFDSVSFVYCLSLGAVVKQYKNSWGEFNSSNAIL